MIYLCDTLESYSDEQYLHHLNALPTWRRAKALQYKKIDDRKRSVLAFVLLQRALREEYGMTEIPAFVYNAFGKPSLPNLSICFSLSHCRDAVACAVSESNIGIDVESIRPYEPEVARRVCNSAELEALRNSRDKDAELIKLWTMKEAIAKYEGFGLSLPFHTIDTSEYRLRTERNGDGRYMLCVCYGVGSRDERMIVPHIRVLAAEALSCIGAMSR